MKGNTSRQKRRLLEQEKEEKEEAEDLKFCLYLEDVGMVQQRMYKLMSSFHLRGEVSCKEMRVATMK